MTTKKTEAKPAAKSNHNTTEPAQPVPTQQVKDMPDYNPMRSEPSKANNQSDTSLSPDDAKDVIDEKGDRPSVAETDAANVYGDKTPASENGDENLKDK